MSLWTLRFGSVMNYEHRPVVVGTDTSLAFLPLLWPRHALSGEACERVQWCLIWVGGRGQSGFYCSFGAVLERSQGSWGPAENSLTEYAV